MKATRIRALRGPNLWSRHTALEAIITCTQAECAIDALPGFEPRVRSLFPAIGALRPGGYVGPVSLAHVLESAALALQAQAGCPVTFSHTAATLEDGVYQTVVEYSEEAVGRLALELAQALIHAALHETGFDMEAAIAQLRDLDEDERIGPSTGAIVDAAVARGIPYKRLTKGSLVQFGWGSRQRRIQAAELDATSAVSESIAQDKDLTKKLLLAAGVPVPMGQPVADPDEAWAAALQIGLPVVLKPQDGNQGKGVTVNIVDRDHLEIAFRAAAEHGTVMVEKFLPGNDFRLLVVGNKLVAASRREPPQVLGDGLHTVRELVDIVNQDPRRGEGHATSLTKIRFDDIAVARLNAQDLTPESIPARGRRVILRNNANLSTGGTATDVTGDVHPDVAARAVAAAQMVGLHICGVDIVCESVLRPLEAQNGGVVEVNAAPGLRMHLSPSYGKGRAVGGAMINELFAPGDDGRVPVVAVTGTNGKTTVTRLISHLLTASGLRCGMTNTDGVYVNGRQTDSGDCSGPKSARNVLMHPDVDAAVFEVARGGVLREGLGFDRCEVAVVTNVGTGDHLGLNYITTVEDLAVLKRVIVQNVAPTGYAVLNAADPIVAAMAPACPGNVIFFAADRHHPLMATHRAQGKRTVYVDGNTLVAAEGAWRERVPLHSIPLTRNGSIGFQVENVMAALAAAWAVGVTWETLKSGLASFVNDAHNAPGRFNVMDYRGATVIADYGHNPDAMRALVSAVEAMPARRRSVVISGAGDRRDNDIRDQTIILGHAFDDVLLYQDAAQRGRADGEVMGLLRDGLVGASRTTHIEEIRGEFLAIDTALARLEPGDLCLILVDQVQEALAHLAERVKETGAPRQVALA
ncbi:MULTISPECIES: cyanophycin synthetase [unclassified Polaromonas]|jgi:cyanophycin synthetase|uniref:cyanophycin synthetase n=1 Tax=unclassified Polaromonas TaxID=2638319 RepID=UPI000BDD0B2A|nr:MULTISPECIES: cyanophycin synthetase [unclassified Polaromonas]OYY38100.1 MAG: cyanophycin synthetase [Polaromonas sp. 35-63-35]OYZ18542.1 MAG: cyanophycin synthetase [Polaromonas sp. 16-63-31]OYZ79650.1 MAG: cyanophycin synthetase [Polaromonas sp. 24-63-21]OZA50795.1 MAG: cyanophycin synthetase [Polaromonas sp. 17-63-33]OZA89654.1 MAG: cyanophycin synthetase [Polaromonas sp. 39-63-25]